MKKIAYQSLLVASVFAILLAIPVPVKKQPVEEKPEDKGDPGYIRYLRQVIDILEEDEDYAKRLMNATEDDIRNGKIADDLDFVNHRVRSKLDELKRREIENQRLVHRQIQDKLNGGFRENWHPVFDENQKTFEVDDFKKLLSKHNDELEKQDEERRKEFKQHEMEKMHEQKEHMKKMDEEARKAEEERLKAVRQHHVEASKSVHHPGSKAQLEEVWEEKDGLEADNFDPRTFFKLHDTNTDGYLDPFELEALFLNEVGKIYNESASDFDPRERDEELARMREHVLKEIDQDKDGFVSIEEFMKATQNPEYEKDDGWKPIEEDQQFTDEEYEEYEKMLRQEEENRQQATEGHEPQQQQEEQHEQQPEQHGEQQQQQQQEEKPAEH